MVIDIQGIRAFLAVSDSASFSRAADRLYLTQPAVSKRIRQLEEALGVALFDRIGRHVHLTEAGRALLPGYRRIVHELEQSRRIVSNLTDTTAGVLSIATSHHIGLHRLPPVLAAYTRAFPHVELDIQFMDSEQALPLILRGDLELALVTLPEKVAEQLRHIPVWSDPMHCVVARGHEITRMRRPTVAQLVTHPAVLPAEGTHTRSLVERALAPQTPQKILLQTHYLETIRAMVEVGLGWSMLPDSMLDERIVPVDIRGLRIDRHLGIVLHEKRTLSGAAKSLVGMLTRNATDR